eukprot:755317-Hanusia_phi.AAC.10
MLASPTSVSGSPDPCPHCQYLQRAADRQQAGRQAGRQADRQTGRQAGRGGGEQRGAGAAGRATGGEEGVERNGETDLPPHRTGSSSARILAGHREGRET